jgi:hypothetical protein
MAVTDWKSLRKIAECGAGRNLRDHALGPRITGTVPATKGPINFSVSHIGSVGSFSKL